MNNKIQNGSAVCLSPKNGEIKAGNQVELEVINDSTMKSQIWKFRPCFADTKWVWDVEEREKSILIIHTPHHGPEKSKRFRNLRVKKDEQLIKNVT
jgi:hypothetical protein